MPVHTPKRKRGMAKGGRVTAAKARKILRDGTIRGKPLTEKQEGLFGAIAGGQKPRKKGGR